MHLKFDANQEHQIRAVEAAVGLFRGQPRLEVTPQLQLGAGAAVVPNRLDRDEAALLKNLNAVQVENGLPPDDAIQYLEDGTEPGNGEQAVRFPNFSVEMETGTGKTYVYVRTALELHRRYGFRKFIIVVPSVAIREGVLKTLKITRPHLERLFENVPYRFYVYDSGALSQVRQFAGSAGVELMVMTIDSFNKAKNVIRQTTDRLQGQTPIHLVRAVRPVLILDEPQNMESELSVKALAGLQPLFALRYSATHRNPYNLLSRLTPFDAYRQGLVKRIEVAAVVTENDENRPYVRLESIKTQKRTISAALTVHKLMRTGAVKEKVVSVRPGDSLVKKTGRQDYGGFEIDEINPGGGFVRFANNLELRSGEAQGAQREALFDAQIRYTVEEHFRKQQRLRPLGIKVLSLFFIDRVDNYVREDGLIRRLFNTAFNEAKGRYAEWERLEPEQVQAAYFAQRRRRGGAVDWLDSSGKAREDEEAYDLIMRDKERLLSLDEPVSFIFSHSALREGWDNPNVFQICTLNHTASETKKRQEIGRGVRLAVNQDGERTRDQRVNVLTVVANESYQRYVGRLQAEIENEYGPEGVPPKPANARRRGTAKLRKQYTLRPEFKELWERVKHKTRYAVRLDTEKLLEEVVTDLDAAEVPSPRVTITKAQVKVGQDEEVYEALQLSAAKTVVSLAGRYPLPNLVDLMANLMEHTTPPTRLTRRTLLEVFRRTTNQQAALDNPQEFARIAVAILKEKLADHLVGGIQYESINEWYEMTQLEAEIESWLDYMVPAKRGVYDHVVCDSGIEEEFVKGLEAREDVRMYLKLPVWFTVPTPVGEYNPDWAVVMEERDAHGEPTGKPFLYLVRETKDKNWRTALRPNERLKIRCGERHFKDALGVDYKVVSEAGELP